MRVMRVTLLMLPLALLLSAAAFGETPNEPTPLTLEQLEGAIFGAPEARSDAPADTIEWRGVCALACRPCWSNYDCPPGDSCVGYCY